MKMHIEYDDFGEYIEVLEDEGPGGGMGGSAACRYDSGHRPGNGGAAERCGAEVLRAGFHKLIWLLAAAAVMLGTTSHAEARLSRAGSAVDSVSSGCYTECD